MIEATAINFKGDLHMFHTELQIIIDHEFVAAMEFDEQKELMEEGKIQYLY